MQKGLSSGPVSERGWRKLQSSQLLPTTAIFERSGRWAERPGTCRVALVRNQCVWGAPSGSVGCGNLANRLSAVSLGWGTASTVTEASHGKKIYECFKLRGLFLRPDAVQGAYTR